MTASSARAVVYAGRAVASASDGPDGLVELLDATTAPETVEGVLTLGTGPWHGEPHVRLAAHFLKDSVVFLTADSARTLASVLRWHAALAAGPADGPAPGDDDAWETWMPSKAATVNPLPYGGWLQAYAPYRSALSGTVLLTAWDTFLLPPEQALALADAADVAAESLAARLRTTAPPASD